jgi:hypothetical protein
VLAVQILKRLQRIAGNSSKKKIQIKKTAKGFSVFKNNKSMYVVKRDGTKNL